ncbi:hypothetical protein ACWGH4_00245 [Streptomyces sp. NPDC054847]
MPRSERVQAPPAGIVWIKDYRSRDGSVVIPGIATRLGISPSTYRKWRMRDQGPVAFIIGKKVAARIDAIESFLADLHETAVREMAQRAEDAASCGRPPEPRATKARAARGGHS